MRFLLLFIALFSYSFTQTTVNINSDDTSIKNFTLGYFDNSTTKLTFNDIQKIKFKKGKNKDSLGAKTKNIWIKIKLLNTTDKKQTLFLHQELAFTFSKINYFILDNHKNLLDKKTISKLSNENKNLIGSDAVIEFTLDPDESKVIYVNQITTAYHFYNFSIFNQQTSIKHLIYEKVDTVLIAGLLFALALYNFLIYLSTRYKEYLYYTLYLSSSTLWIVYVYGSFSHYLQIYNEFIIKFNFGLMLAPIFLTLFIQALFQTKTKYTKENQFLNALLIILILNLIFAFVNFQQAFEILAIVVNIAVFLFLGVAISIYRKGSKIVKIFLFAHIFYIIFSTYGLLFYMGVVEFNYISLHGVGIGIMIEAMLLSYLVSYKFKIIQNEKEKERISRLEAVEKQNRSLADNKKLKELLKERKVLLQEVLHRVKNNFHMIIGILWMQGNKAKDSTIFNELISKIRSMSQINNYLYRSENITKIQTDQYFGDIINFSSSLVSKNKLIVQRDIDKLELPFETAMNLGLILNELLTNSIKHNIDLDQIVVKIIFKKQNNKYSLTVHDNSKKFNPNHKNKGIGLILIEDLSSKLPNAHQEFYYKKGTYFCLEFEIVL